MSERNLLALIKASDKGAKAQVQHVVLALTPDGQIQMNGSRNMIDGLMDKQELLDEIKSTMIASKQEDGNVAPATIIDYPLLPCSIYSPGWKGTKIRTALTKMVARAGSGRKGRTQSLGAGFPPHGWPVSVIPWDKYKGSTRSGLSANDCTAIIIALLRAANIDEKKHIIHGDSKETEDPEKVESDEEQNSEEFEEVENYKNIESDFIFSGDIVYEDADQNADTIELSLEPEIKKRNIGII